MEGRVYKEHNDPFVPYNVAQSQMCNHNKYPLHTDKYGRDIPTASTLTVKSTINVPRPGATSAPRITAATALATASCSGTQLLQLQQRNLIPADVHWAIIRGLDSDANRRADASL